MDSNRDILGGLLVLRAFLVIVFGAAAIVGVLLIGERTLSFLWDVCALVLIAPACLLALLFFAAAADAVRELRNSKTLGVPEVKPVQLSVQEPVQPIEPAAAPAEPVQSSIGYHMQSFQERVAKARQQRAYWLQRKRDRLQGGNR